jgi:acyl-coenzyme A synthetase/AMP-(fatty) acid ligase/acyl carrier protein
VSDHSKYPAQLPPDQQAIRANYFHPTGTFVKFKKEEIEQSIPERFETMVRLYPDRLAVKMDDRALTYNELNIAANRIARAILRQCGPGSEPIALLFEHGIDVITAAFGILKAGKFYVALDRRFGKERTEYVLDDSSAPLIATDTKNFRLSHSLTNASRSALNVGEIDVALSGDDLNLPVSPNSPAMLAYTSGSTGMTKGVVKSHLFTLHNVSFISNALGIAREDRLTLLHPMSSSAHESNLYTALLTGAALFPFELDPAGIQQLPSWLAAEQISSIHLVPSVFRQVAMSLASQQSISKLRMIRLSGEPIIRGDFELYRQHFSAQTSLVFGMGTSEAGALTYAKVNHNFVFPEHGTPIGYSCPGKTIFLLDESGQEVAPGEIGEIGVKVGNLTTTYWRRPELNDDKWLADPSGNGEHRYLTGDLGVKRPDGFFIHMGRKDFTVKVRGYWVDTSEIERALLSHALVKNAGVVAWGSESGEKNIVAYIVPRSNPPTVDELSSHLREKLPDYMVPSAFMYLESLPLTNGKLDRRALPRLDGKRPELSQPYVPPQNEVERRLSEIWSEVLSLDRVGIHDSFFDLGGHSLGATRVASRVLKWFQLEIPLPSLFNAPTVAEMANVITTHQAKRLGEQEMEKILTELESLTDKEAQRLLSSANDAGHGKD